jgi:hypothetical protein
VGEKYAPEVKWDGTHISIRARTWELGAGYHRIIVEAGNEWPVHIAVAVLMTVEESRGEGAQRSQGPRRDTLLAARWGTCGARFDLSPIKVGDQDGVITGTPIRSKREPPRLTGWTLFSARVLQFIACIPRFLFSIFESELNMESSLSV